MKDGAPLTFLILGQLGRHSRNFHCERAGPGGKGLKIKFVPKRIVVMGSATKEGAKNPLGWQGGVLVSRGVPGSA